MFDFAVWDFTFEDFIKLLLALGVGGLVGLEREYRDKAAGMRTMMFICVGATLFTIFSVKLGETGVDRTRIAANIVSGVGFLGAGAIIRDAGRVVGLTTAATIWIVAALGMGIGSGAYAFSIMSIAFVLVAMLIVPPIEKFIGRRREARTYRVICPLDTGRIDELEALLTGAGLRIRMRKRSKREGRLSCTWDTIGSTTNHDRASRMLLEDERVEEVKF